jgi:hypothetical protein
MAGYTGILQVDGYSAYTRLAKTGTCASNDTVTLAGCWAHLRRRFYELHLNGSSRLATQTVTTMAELWKIDGDICGVAPNPSKSLCRAASLVRADGYSASPKVGPSPRSKKSCPGTTRPERPRHGLALSSLRSAARRGIWENLLRNRAIANEHNC